MVYDNNGNLATLTESGQTTTYTWDARDRLTNLSGPGLSASFAYDQNHRRTQKTVAGFTTTFQYDGLDIVREIAGGAEVNYLRGLDIDEPLARIEASATTCFLGDALDSTLALTNSAGAVATEYTYEPFGRTQPAGTSSPNALQYTARENDGTGLYYYRARYYHPGLMRFIAEDPLGLDGGDANFYAYVSGNPLALADPTGLAACCDAQLPESPIREVALTCFAEASGRCRRAARGQEGREKRAITDSAYNRQTNLLGGTVPHGNYYLTGGSAEIVDILAAPGPQYRGYENPRYRQARDHTVELQPRDCQHLKDCIAAARGSAGGTREPYTHFQRSRHPRDAARICNQWFWTRPQPRGSR
jgi:RHS repeat-associated protein